MDIRPSTPQAWGQNSDRKTPGGLTNPSFPGEIVYAPQMKSYIQNPSSATANSQSHKPQLGPPPSDVISHAPTFSLAPRQPFGKLELTLIRGKNLKAGQGVLGKADPYVKIKLDGNEALTEPDSQGGKNPVSLKRSNLFFLDHYASWTYINESTKNIQRIVITHKGVGGKL